MTGKKENNVFVTYFQISKDWRFDLGNGTEFKAEECDSCNADALDIEFVGARAAYTTRSKFFMFL
jgi:hypothetical protein